MNLLFVTHAYPRSEGDVAGAFIERLAVALQERDHVVRIVAPADRGRGGRDFLRGIAVSRVRYAPKWLESLAYTGTMVESSRSPHGAFAVANLMRAQAAEIRREARRGPLDLVHAHWWIPAGVSAWLARIGGMGGAGGKGGSGKKPYVVTVHGTDVRILERSRLGRLIARRILRDAAGVTAVSSHLAEKVARVAGIDAANITVQPMPVLVQHFARGSTGGDGIVALGRLTKQKNLNVILEALAYLKTDGTNVPLKIIGDGPERSALELLAKQLSIDDRVRFVGSVDPHNVTSVIGNADVMAFAGSDEGFGLAAAESLMLGIPVVASQTGGGVRDVVPPTGPGRLVPANDPASMAGAIREFLNNAESRGLALEAGQTLKNQLKPEAVSRVFESVYENALRRQN